MEQQWSERVLYENNRLLDQRQNKNDSIQTKTIPILKLPRFSPRQIGGE